MEANNFYQWWTEKIKGNHITNEKFEMVLERFEDINNEFNN